ncbi:MAG TPA: aminoglycoside phosphotransferase family protein [Candidatus Saccharimonadales bacterium]|nr:aminoglycoside phosphotransferase family protein [Candidatus Saccharimonadales bacterium]
MEVSWYDIEHSIETLAKTDGGFSSAHRGVVTLPDGRQVFVKLGVDGSTKKWAKKEIETYRFLHRNGYAYIPQLIAYNEDETGFALELLSPEVGWNWQDEWTEARLNKTLEAMDTLAAIKPVGADKEYFSDEMINESDDGWQPLNVSHELQERLLGKLRETGRDDLAAVLNFAAEAARSSQFRFQKDVLVHNDVRADNRTWNAKLQTVKLVDWNWTQLGDRRVDVAAMLVHVHKAGMDVTKKNTSHLNADALHWMAGFWFKSAATPIWPGGPAHLRDMQLQSGITALELAGKVQ